MEKIGLLAVMDIDDFNRAMRQYKKEVDGADKETDKATKGMSKSFGNLSKEMKLGLVAAGAIAARAIKQFVDESITAASDAEEAWSKFGVVFGDTADDTKQSLQALADATGLSINKLAPMAATLGDTLKPMGFATVEASKLSTQLVTLAGDLASFNNMSMDEALRRLQGTLIGSHENALAFGVIINENTLKAELAAQGWDKLTGTQLEQAKVQARINLLMRGTTDAQGDLIRTADSYANKQRALESATYDLQVRIGEGLLPVAVDLTEQLIEMADKAMPAIDAATGKNAATIEEVTKNTIAQTDSLDDQIAMLKKAKGSWDLAHTTMGKLAGTTDATEEALRDMLTAVAANVSSYDEFEQAAAAAGISQVDLFEMINAGADGVHTNTLAFYENARAIAEEERNLRAAAAAGEYYRNQYMLPVTYEKPAVTGMTREAAIAFANEERTLAAAAEAGEFYRNQYMIPVTLETRRAAIAQQEHAIAMEEARIKAEELALSLSNYFNAALTGTAETNNFEMQLYEAGAAAGLGAEQLAVLAGATGEFTAEEIEAAFQAALMRQNIDELVTAMQNGTITAGEATTALELLKSGEAKTAGEAMGLAAAFNGVTGSLYDLTGSANDARVAIDSIPTEKRVKILVEQQGLSVGMAKAIAPEFQTGGYTGNVSPRNIAGIVHGSEYVFSAQATKNLGVGFLESMHLAASRAGGGASAGRAVAPSSLPPAPIVNVDGGADTYNYNLNMRSSESQVSLLQSFRLLELSRA